MDNLILLKQQLEKGRQKIFNKTRICLAKNCSKKAIGSHVLQVNGILKNIIDNTNHFYSIAMINIFKMEPDNAFEIKKVGINEGYRFFGFCNEHDTAIFKPIETHPIDFSDKRNLALFTYRTACLELRKKEIYLEQSQNKLETYRKVQPDKIHYIDFKPAQLAVKDLKYYKKEIESDLKNYSNLNFEYKIVELPEKKLCFSSPLSISDPSNEMTYEYDKYGFERLEPLATSFLNYFPYNGKSYLISAIHKKYKCNWTKELITKFQTGDNIDKILSDLLTYRLEFWGIAPELYETFSSEKVNRFKIDSHRYWDNYEYEIRSDFNLFS